MGVRDMGELADSDDSFANYIFISFYFFHSNFFSFLLFTQRYYYAWFHVRFSLFFATFVLPLKGRLYQ